MELSLGHYRRVGGTLRFNGEFLPVDSTVKLVDVAAGIASLVTAQNLLVPVRVTDVTAETFRLTSAFTAFEGQAAFELAKSDEVTGGRTMAIRENATVRRTGRPFVSTREHLVPLETDLVVTGAADSGIQLRDTDGQTYSVPHEYFTDGSGGYFDIVRQTVVFSSASLRLKVNGATPAEPTPPVRGRIVLRYLKQSGGRDKPHTYILLDQYSHVLTFLELADAADLQPPVVTLSGLNRHTGYRETWTLER